MTLDPADILTAGGLAALIQVVVIDLSMAGDNVVIMGTLASGLPPERRRRVILLGVAAALIFLIGFALIANWLLQLTGLVLAGGLLLLWVAWHMYRELRAGKGARTSDSSVAPPPVSFWRAAIQVTLADLSMSLDNVLAVAGAARDHPTVMVIGLVLSVTIMGLAAQLVARVIGRMPWIAWIGLAMITFVAGRMIVTGWFDVHPHIVHALGR